MKEEQKAPEIEYEIKKRNKKTTSAVNFDTQAHALPPAIRKQFKDLEHQLFADDQKILNLKEAKNNLESYIYDMRANVKEYGNYEKYIDPETKERLLADVSTTEEWIYNSGEQNGELFVQTRLLQKDGKL